MVSLVMLWWRKLINQSNQWALFGLSMSEEVWVTWKRCYPAPGNVRRLRKFQDETLSPKFLLWTTDSHFESFLWLNKMKILTSDIKFYQSSSGCCSKLNIEHQWCRRILSRMRARIPRTERCLASVCEARMRSCPFAWYRIISHNLHPLASLLGGTL